MIGANAYALVGPNVYAEFGLYDSMPRNGLTGFNTGDAGRLEGTARYARIGYRVDRKRDNFSLGAFAFDAAPQGQFGEADNANDTLQQFRLAGSYHHDQTWGTTLGMFNTHGSLDATRYASSRNASPNTSGGRHKKGPSLAGVIGRKAGTVAGFERYSDAMKASGVTWSAERIDAYVAQPRKLVPGGRMKYDGLAQAQARADLVACLSTLR